MNKHTPLPWANHPRDDLYENQQLFGGVIRGTVEGCVDISDEDAEFIVRACNSHYDLVSLVEKCIKLEKSRREKLTMGCVAYTFADQRIEELEAALKKAKGESQ